MTEQGKQNIITYLKSLKWREPFTIEQLVRTLGQNKGESWTLYELQGTEEIEKYLLREKLIKDTGRTVKIFNAEANTLKDLS